jgi:hypothetical protein
MPDYLVTGTRRLTIVQEGTAWIEAEDEDEAQKIAEDDPEALDWSWDLISEDNADDIDSVEIQSVKDEDEVENPDDDELTRTGVTSPSAAETHPREG